MAFDRPEAVPIEGGDRGAQDHLDWIIDQKAEILRLQNYLALLYGGTTGVIAYPPQGLLSLRTEGDDDMSLTFNKGKAFYDSHPSELTGDWESGNIPAPVSNPRIDWLGINCANETPVMIEGTEAASPSVPATPADHLKLGELLLRTTSVKILLWGVADDSVNGFITDSRVWLNV